AGRVGVTRIHGQPAGAGATRRTAKIVREASNPSRTMKSFFFVVLLSALGWAQATAPKPVANPSESDNARKARTLLDQAVQALGGQAYLNYENRSERGRFFPMNHGRTDTLGIAYARFFKYPDKDRLEVLHTHGTVKITERSDFILIHNGDKGYEVSFKGTTTEDPKDTAAYIRRRQHSIERVFRKWMSDPGVELFYDGMAVVDARSTDQITLLNSQNDAVTVYLDQGTHLPAKCSYSWRDPEDKQRNIEEEVYDNYRPIQGIMTPYSVVRNFNGEMSQQRFVHAVKYNDAMSDSLFDASITYDAKEGPRKRKR
ncbi:MAG TPA: hypothetical protein VGV15_17695, partial [Terriglobales bacterium]|nr:hypothetical protein [Terriglobales bacterium]